MSGRRGRRRHQHRHSTGPPRRPRHGAGPRREARAGGRGLGSGAPARRGRAPSTRRPRPPEIPTSGDGTSRTNSGKISSPGLTSTPAGSRSSLHARGGRGAPRQAPSGGRPCKGAPSRSWLQRAPRSNDGTAPGAQRPASTAAPPKRCNQTSAALHRGVAGGCRRQEHALPATHETRGNTWLNQITFHKPQRTAAPAGSRRHPPG